MNNQFDELTKGLAQSVTRRAALKKFGVGLAGMALACFGLASKGQGAHKDCLPDGTICKAGKEGGSLPRCSKCCNGYSYDAFETSYHCGPLF